MADARGTMSSMSANSCIISSRYTSVEPSGLGGTSTMSGSPGAKGISSGSRTGSPISRCSGEMQTVWSHSSNSVRSLHKSHAVSEKRENIAGCVLPPKERRLSTFANSPEASVVRALAAKVPSPLMRR